MNKIANEDELVKKAFLTNSSSLAILFISQTLSGYQQLIVSQ